jgi:hypothetical protein
MVFVGIGAHGPLIASAAMTYQQGGWLATKQLLCAGFNVRMAWRWWLAIITIPFLLNGLAVCANVFLNGYRPDRSLLDNPIMIVPTLLIVFFLYGPVQEEFGWRGYALPKLLRKFNPLSASLVLGAVWGLWHLPLFYIPGTGQSNMPFWIFLCYTAEFSIVYTWLFLQTSRNLFSALLLHATINTSMAVFPPVEERPGGSQIGRIYAMIAYSLLGIMIVLLDRNRWLKTPVT